MRLEDKIFKKFLKNLAAKTPRAAFKKTELKVTKATISNKLSRLSVSNNIVDI